MGFKPTTLRDLAGGSNHWATGDCMVSKVEKVGLCLKLHHTVKQPNNDLASVLLRKEVRRILPFS